MKLICSKSNLLTGASIVSKAVPNKTTMSILECILVDATKGVITLTANDMELGIETTIEGDILEKGIIALDAKIFLEIVRKLPDSDIYIESTPDYKTIKRIIVETGLTEYFDYRTLVKIHFNPEDIKAFLDEFKCNRTNDLIVEFAGYVNKPFNCINYLNDYYLGDVERQTKEISKRLSGRHFLGDLRGRLKNILYFII